MMGTISSSDTQTDRQTAEGDGITPQAETESETDQVPLGQTKEAETGAEGKPNAIVSKDHDDETDETVRCKRSGLCEVCTAEEDKADADFCMETGKRELVHCQVWDDDAELVSREYTLMQSCDTRVVGGARALLGFESVCACVLLIALWVMRGRMQKVQGVHERRLERLVNS